MYSKSNYSFFLSYGVCKLYTVLQSYRIPSVETRTALKSCFRYSDLILLIFRLLFRLFLIMAIRYTVQFRFDERDVESL